MKKSCNNCRALAISQYSSYCTLGYATKIIEKVIQGTGIRFNRTIPAEPCPKPLTYKEYFKCTKKTQERRKGNDNT